MAPRLLSLALALAAVAGCCASGLAQTPTLESGLGTLQLSAALSGSAAPLTGGLRWRLFAARPDLDGAHPLIVESGEPQPTLTAPAGDYVVHVALGLASAVKRVPLGQEVRAERLTLNAGALRITATLGDALIDPAKLSLAIYVPQRNNPEAKLVDAKARAGDIIGLPEGAYHIVSTFLDTVGVGSIGLGKSGGAAGAPTPTNSIVAADVKVVAGKLIDLTMRHRYAAVTIKLVNAAGAEALANSSFTVLTPGGDVIKESIGAFPRVVLAEGDYHVIARNEAKTYHRDFKVITGVDGEVEVLAR